MPSTYSTNLKLELMSTGENSGTWGTKTNTNLGTLLEQAVVGYETVSITDGADTVITIADGVSSTARNYVLELTGSLSANRNLIVPAIEKPYIIYNNTTGGYSVTVKVSGQTGVTVANGKKAIVYNNGTDVIEVANAPVTEAGTQTLTNKTLTSPTINGGTINNASVGSGTPAAGSFTTLAASGAVSGVGFSNYLASPPSIGNTAAGTIRGTTVTATTGFSGPLNGTVGATTPSTGAFTTLSASSTVSGAGFSTYLASPPAIGGTAANTGSFTTLAVNGNVTLNGQAGTSGQVLTSAGAGSVPTWTTLSLSRMVFIGAQAAYNGNVTFTSIPSFSSIVALVSGRINTGTNQRLRVAISSNNGSSYGSPIDLTNSIDDTEFSFSGSVTISNTNAVGNKTVTPAVLDRYAVYTTAGTESVVTGVTDALQFSMSSTSSGIQVTLFGIP